MSNAINYLGKIVCFNYNGGTKPNSRRRVYVHSESFSTIHGWDFDKKEHRNFSIDKMSNLEIQDGNRNNGFVIKDLPEFLVNSTRSNLEAEGFDCFEDVERGSWESLTSICWLAASKPIAPKYVYDVRGNNSGLTIDITHSTGPHINMSFGDSGDLLVNGMPNDIPGLVSCLSLFMLDCDEVDVILGIESALMKIKERDKDFESYV
jgi:hypothetical protein